MFHKKNWDNFIGWCKVRGTGNLYNKDRCVMYKNGVNYRYDYDYDWYSDGDEWHTVDTVKIYNGDNWATISRKSFKKLFVVTGTNLIYKCKDENLKDYDEYYLEEES